ncbi:MAG: ABC transporter ATP-binding protein/permease [Planctomycetota bacterium]|jgi:subfamily B ATP-binding cassette protein MsbA|nr:ABC transporter ATP-binding protein/permease [Planctomycetota bacterium]
MKLINMEWMDRFISRGALGDLRQFSRFVRPYLFRGVLSVLMSMPVGAMEAMIAAILKPFTDMVLDGNKSGKLPDMAYYPLLIIVFTLLQSAFKYASGYLTHWSGMKIANSVKMALFNRLMHNDAAAFDRMTSGGALMRYYSDADSASSGLIGNVNFFVNRFFMSVSLIAVMFWNSWMLAIVAVLALLLAFVPMLQVKKKIKTLMTESVMVGGLATTRYNEVFGGNRTVAAYDLYDHLNAEMRKTLDFTFRLGIKITQRVGLMSMGMHGALAIGIAAVIWLQGIMIAHDLITPGAFVSFLATLLMLYTPLKGISGNYNGIQMSLLAMRRVLSALDSRPAITDRPGAARLERVARGIRYSGVEFSYSPDKPVLRGIDLEIAAGQTVAFVGGSGGGKTTLVSLLPRFYDVSGGSISIDGVDIRDFSLESLRRNIAIVFQDNFLFGGSIRDNILMGRRDASEEDLARAAAAACLDDFVDSLPKGLDTEIGERGVMLSGGQRQRVAVARAFIKDAPIIILDEATSSLDNQSEAVVQRAIDNLMQDKTVLIIAHRLSTVIHADRIVVIQDGLAVESGTHAELLARPDGSYASLYQAQLNYWPERVKFA